MTPAPYTIGKEQPLSTARELMRHHGIRHLPVMHGGQLVGVLSDRDIDFALRVDKRDPESLSVEDAFTDSVYTVAEHTPLHQVASEMGSQRIGCAIVVDDRERLVGIFTAVDACTVLSQILTRGK
jgi:acetoin utilization protein AcuB